LDWQVIYIQNGEDLKNGIVKNINVIPVPEDGILRLPLVAYPQNGNSDETYFKDFSFSVRSYYGGGSRVVGQVHKDFQSKVIKNREEKDIYLDNSPSWYIKGTLYLGTTNVLRDKCKQWQYPAMAKPYNSLGLATTQEELYQNYIPRAKYEGNLLYTKIGAGPYQFVNPLSVFQKTDAFQYFKFVPGKVTIDYKNAAVDLTIYEIINNPTGFDDSGNVAQYEEWAVQSYYEFKYLYDK
jgi:hypothetical protein